MRYSRFLLVLVVLGLGFPHLYTFSSPSPADKSKKKDGDRTQYYKKWLDEDVTYIISDDERKVFKDLKNDEEREAFIEQFWLRRNTDPRGGDNQFKEEHYRRIAYANQHFTSGIPGWKTDRGRIYIMYGKPDEIETHPSGGAYNRPFNEGGGTTTTYPFEKWWYRHLPLEGTSDDIELEFVDPSGTGEYRLAMSPDEKDALLNVPGAGLTLAEEMGLSEKKDRPYFNPSAYNDPNNPQTMFMRAKDSPFSRMEQYFNVQRPPMIKFEDLKSVVSTKITYNTFPYDVRTDYIKLSSDKVLVPITVEINNKNLEFKKEMDVNRASVNVYGIVTGLNGRVAWEFEDTIVTEYSDENFDRGKNNRSEYQKVIALAPGQRYKLDLVLKDVNSKNVGPVALGLTVPKYDETTLHSSTIILANSISAAPLTSDQLEQYVIGDLKVLPNVKAEYVPGQNLISYLQVYGLQIDQTNQKPSIEVMFSVKGEGGKVVHQLKDLSGTSMQFYSGQRIVILGNIPLKGVPPGKYTLDIQVTDNIANRNITTSTHFTIKDQVEAVTAITPK